MTIFHSRIHRREAKKLRRQRRQLHEQQKIARRFLQEVEAKRAEMSARMLATGPESFAIAKTRRSWWRRLLGR